MKATHTFYRISSTKWLQTALLAIVLILSSNCYSQNYKTNDTIHVDEVVVSGESISKFQAGAKIEKIASQQFELAQDGNLKQLLSRLTTIALKANASGRSTIFIRGTSSKHTGIFFGGISINSLTLGEANASLIPIFLFDELGIQYGSSSSVNGSGNIGGALHLGIKNYWVDGLKTEARISHGSFGEQLYGTKIFIGNGNFETVTRAYYYYKKNNFKFSNTEIKNWSTGEIGVNDVQRNANVENMGLIQELNYRHKKNQFNAMIWLEDDWNLVQQNMATNYKSPDKRDTHEDKNLRLWSKYKFNGKKIKYNLGAGYVYDKSIYNHNTQKAIQTKRIIGETWVEHDLSENISYKVGTKAMQIQPIVYAYDKTLDFENRLDFFVSYYHTLFNKLKLTANLRKGYVTNFDSPITPSAGISYILISAEKYIVNISGNVAKSYRVPTFNDRYWLPGGNPSLKPEDGINYEIGTKFSYCDGHTSGNVKINLFYMDINNWLLWTPNDTLMPQEVLQDPSISSFWYAQNVLNVISRGIELITDAKYKLSGFNIHSGLNLSLTETYRKESIKSNVTRRQMEYVPFVNGNVFTTQQYKNFSFTIDGNYTHSRYIAERGYDKLAPYFLLNLTTSYKFNINKTNQLKISGMVNNILNTSYQSSERLPMPGINYRISLTYNLN